MILAECNATHVANLFRRWKISPRIAYNRLSRAAADMARLPMRCEGCVSQSLVRADLGTCKSRLCTLAIEASPTKLYDSDPGRLILISVLAPFFEKERALLPGPLV